MKLIFRMVIGVAALAVWQAVAATGRVTLADYFKAHPWDFAAKGPMLVVAPDTVEAMSDEGGLDAFARMTATCGGLTAIVPTEMVIIDATLKDPPNIYDGLPRDDKMLYLMSTMTSDQWQTAAAGGIGRGDLMGEQKAVFDSLLPNQFRWNSFKVSEDATGLTPVSAEGLTSEQAKSVQIHFFLDLGFTVHLKNRNGITGVSTQFQDSHSPGQTVLIRDKKEENGSDSVFGVQVRKVLPNKQKPSDLKFSNAALDGQLSLPNQATIDESLKLLSASSGLTIVADERLGHLKVVFSGKQARSGDVLNAIALAVTGAYRRVGSTYELTSDIEGIGARKLKIALWTEQIEEAIVERRQTWLRTIGQNHGLGKLTYLPGETLTPNDEMRRWMSASDQERDPDGVSLSALPESLQAIVQREAARVEVNQPIRIDHVMPVNEVFWNFVLPDGRALQWEASAGGTGRFGTRPPYDWKSAPIDPIRPLTVTPTAPGALAVRADDASELDEAITAARDHGFSEIWVQTLKQRVLASAVEKATRTGLKVRLVIRPWEATPAARIEDEDRTILGETAPETANRRAASTLVVEIRHIPLMAPHPTLSPSDPSIKSKWSQLGALALTPGLAGTVLCDTEPSGYEPARSRSMYAFFSHELAYSLGLGYSSENREKFLNQSLIDPIDITDVLYTIDSPRGPSPDLTLPFFKADRSGQNRQYESEPSGYELKWDSFMAKQNSSAITRLASEMPLPFLVEARRQTKEMTPTACVPLMPWQPGSSPPSFEESEDLKVVSPEGCTILVRAWPGMSPRVSRGVWHDLAETLSSAPRPFAVDMTSLTPDQWSTLLDAWFVKRLPTNNLR